MVILKKKKKKKKKKKIYWPDGPVENQLLWPELARPPFILVQSNSIGDANFPWPKHSNMSNRLITTLLLLLNFHPSKPVTPQCNITYCITSKYLNQLTLRVLAKLNLFRNPQKIQIELNPIHPPPIQTSLTWTENSNHND